VLAKLPQAELEQSLNEFLAPLTQLLPDQRLKRVAAVAVQGILAGQSPVVAAMAQSVSRQDANPWAAAKRVYRLLDNDRFTHALLQQGLYQVTQSTVRMQMQRETLPYLVVAVDPVNFEKPYTEKLEGVSIVHKSTPPDLRGGARLARGYPAITATVVNTLVPATTYAQWFSYVTDDFLSQNKEVERAIVTTRQLFPSSTHRVRFVGDAGLDDQKVFGQVEKVQAEFVIRACHLNRIVQVYNPRLDRWETERLQDLVSTIPAEGSFEANFTHAGYSWTSTVTLGWLLVRLPSDEGDETEQEGQEQQPIWALIAEDTDEKGKERTLVLLTNVPIHTMEDAQQLYSDWRMRGRIEHGYRFDQEQGLDVEDMRVRTLERMRRLFVLVLVAAQFVFYLMDSWPAAAVQWLRRLGGKLGLGTDRDGPYIVLRGLSAVWQAVAALTWLLVCPFPHQEFQSCG